MSSCMQHAGVGFEHMNILAVFCIVSNQNAEVSKSVPRLTCDNDLLSPPPPCNTEVSSKQSVEDQAAWSVREQMGLPGRPLSNLDRNTIGGHSGKLASLYEAA